MQIIHIFKDEIKELDKARQKIRTTKKRQEKVKPLFL